MAFILSVCVASASGLRLFPCRVGKERFLLLAPILGAFTFGSRPSGILSVSLRPVAFAAFRHRRKDSIRSFFNSRLRRFGFYSIDGRNASRTTSDGLPSNDGISSCQYDSTRVPLGFGGTIPLLLNVTIIPLLRPISVLPSAAVGEEFQRAVNAVSFVWSLSRQGNFVQGV